MPYKLALCLVALCFSELAVHGQPPSRYEIVIDEIMADPTPAVGLPDAEYVEIRNVSTRTIDLSGCRLAAGSKLSGPAPRWLLPPDNFVVITSTAHQPLLAPYGNCIGITGFPAITNSGATISFIGPDGSTLHAVHYNPSSYQNTLKAQGGWSLEMIDVHDPCGGTENWRASEDANGGTPGRINSVNGTVSDDAPPQLQRSVSVNTTTITAIFDKPLDSSAAAVASHYEFSNGIAVVGAYPQPPLFNTVQLALNSPMDSETVYVLHVSDVADCKGNTIGVHNICKAGVAISPKPLDVVVNEILYNPRPHAFDYVELYNTGHKTVDLARMYIANRDETGALGTIRTCSSNAFYLFPGEYAVLTENSQSLAREYFVQNPDAALELTSLPAFPDNKGTVVLLNGQGNVIDEVSYSDAWQFPLISNSAGVSLERIDPYGASQLPSNWHSASSTSGYGTPTYKNSQYGQQNGDATLTIQPPVFSPDNDGRDDFTIISYQMEAAGNVANCIIFDSYGNAVRHLVSNALLGRQGQWTWDGLDDKGQLLKPGIYIVYTELFNLQGHSRSFKQAVTLIRKL